MSERFLKFRGQINRRRVLLCVALGLMLGIGVTSVLVILAKREIMGLRLLPSILIGLGVALLSTGVGLLLTRFDEKALARRLDEENSLGERTSTMVAFREDSREMARLQREDAQRALESVSAPKLRPAAIVTVLVAGLLSVSLLVTAAALPTKQPPAPEPPAEEEGFLFTEWQKTRLLALIEYVRASDLRESIRPMAVEELEGLYDTLLTVTKRADMVAEVTSSMVVIDDAVKAVNTYDPIVKHLSLSTEESIRRLAASMGRVTGDIPSQEITDLATLLAKKTENPLPELATKLEIALMTLEIDREDAVFKAVGGVIEQMRASDAWLATDTEEARIAALEQWFTDQIGTVRLAAAQQSADRSVADTVITELMFIFGLTKNDLPASLLEDGNKYEDIAGDYEEKDDELHGGGAGRDEMVYASDDEIFDPTDGKHVPYGEVLKDYFAVMNDRFINGELPEEYKNFIRDYFDALYNSDYNEQE